MEKVILEDGHQERHSGFWDPGVYNGKIFSNMLIMKKWTGGQGPETPLSSSQHTLLSHNLGNMLTFGDLYPLYSQCYVLI